ERRNGVVERVREHRRTTGPAGAVRLRGYRGLSCFEKRLESGVMVFHRTGRIGGAGVHLSFKDISRLARFDGGRHTSSCSFSSFVPRNAEGSPMLSCAAWSLSISLSRTWRSPRIFG